MYSFTSISLLLLTFCFGLNCYLQGVPERADIVYANSKYVRNGSVQVRRYGRKSPYYVNIKGVLMHTWTNNVSVTLDFFEYLHNEYKPTFVKMHNKLCEVFKKDSFIGAFVRDTHFACPVPQGPVELNNLTLQVENFPYEFPMNKGLANFTLTVTSTNELIGCFRIYGRINQNRRKDH